MRRIYIVIIILIITSLACGITKTVTPVASPATLPTQPVATHLPTDSPTAVPQGTQAPGSKVTPTPTVEEPTKAPYPTSVLNAQMTDQINQIQSQVIQYRGLQLKYPVPVVLLNTAELRKNITEDFLADYSDEDSADDVYELSIIGLLEPDFDYKTFYINLLSEGVAGYYDNDIKEMFVVSDQGFDGPAHLTYSHEFTHALQDQNYDIKNGLKYSDDACEVDTERCEAVQALIEGDATLSELTWFRDSASLDDKLQITNYLNNLKSPVYDSAPDYIKQDFFFPYSQGLTFIQYFYDEGGWQAVDNLYKDPPVSTEQILHPERYPADKPISVDLPDLSSVLGDVWHEVSHDQMGEWDTYLILAHGVDQAARLDDTTAQTASAGWGGDEYQVLHNDSANTTAFVMKTVWDTANDAGEFSSALQKSLNSRFGLQATQQASTSTWTYSGGYSSLLLSGSTTIWILAPDAATAQVVSGQVQP